MSKVIRFQTFGEKDKVNESNSPLEKKAEIYFGSDIEIRFELPKDLCYDKYGQTEQLVYSNMMPDQKEALDNYLNPIVTEFMDNGIDSMYQASGDYYDHGDPDCFVAYMVNIGSLDEMRGFIKAIDKLGIE